MKAVAARRMTQTTIKGNQPGEEAKQQSGSARDVPSVMIAEAFLRSMTVDNLLGSLRALLICAEPTCK